MNQVCHEVPCVRRLSHPLVFLLLALLLALLLFGAIGSAGAQEQGNARGTGAAGKAPWELWFFFSPSEKGLAREVRSLRELLRDHRDLSLRPCLLVGDWRAIQKPTRDFADTIKELHSLIGPGFSLRVWDAEGLALARRLRIGRLPAYALLARSGRTNLKRTDMAHVAFGRGADFKELLSCRSHR